MKKTHKFLILSVVGIAVAFFIVLSLAVSIFAKSIAISQMQENLNASVSIERVGLRLPFTLRISGLRIGVFFKADTVSFSPNILSIFAGKIILSGLTLENPEITVKQYPSGKFNLPIPKQVQGKQPPVLLTDLTIQNGRFIFKDKKSSATGFKVILDKINVNISKIMLPPTSLNTRFKAAASFITPEAKDLGSLSASGWIDLGPKNMDATFLVKDLDLTYFFPYYGNFISSKKLLSATLNFASELKAKDNNLNIASKLKLSGLSYVKEESKEGEASRLDLIRNTLDLFTDANGNLNLEFSIDTKLDKPGITIEGLRKLILSAASKNLLKQSPQALIEKVTDNMEQIKALGKELKDLFKQKQE